MVGRDAGNRRRPVEWPEWLPARLVGVVFVFAGGIHLLLPGTLLATGRVAYDLALRVRFEPRDGAHRRVRVVGAAMVAAGLHLLYHGGLIPE
jgi:hypothetical protein